MTTAFRRRNAACLRSPPRLPQPRESRCASAVSCAASRSLSRPIWSRVEAIAGGLGLPVKRLPSGAGHDARMLAAVCPACMIFVPSVNGISHNVLEYTAPDDLAAGANVLLRLMLELAD